METRTWVEFKREALKDKEIAAEYEKLGPEFELAKMLIRKRLDKKMTQRQLARKIGTKQEAISRLESGSYNPTFLMLQKIAQDLGARLTVSMK